MAKKKTKIQPASRGRPLVGKKGFTVKFFPDFVDRIDAYINSHNEKSAEQIDRSTLIETAVDQLLKRRDA